MATRQGRRRAKGVRFLRLLHRFSISTSPRRERVPLFALAVLAMAAVSPATLHADLAGTAAILFEATPFVLAADLTERALAARRQKRATMRRARVCDIVATLVGCGCGGRLGGALSLPAFGLCWLVFGPLVASLKLALGLALSVRILRRCDEGHPVSSLDELRRLAPSAAFAAFVASTLAALPPKAGFPPLAFALGLLGGAFAPCAAGAIALAGTLRATLPAAALGLVIAAGLPLLPARANAHAARSVPAPAGYAALALACTWLTVRGGAGFVHPRLLPLIALSAVLALLAAALDLRAAKTRERYRGAFVPALLSAALLIGSPLPSSVATETTLSDAFPGERVAFMGTAQDNAGATVLVRYAITCCRADAAPVALRLAHRIAVSRGTWLSVVGTMRRTPAGFVLATETAHAVAPPLDPFVYR